MLCQTICIITCLHIDSPESKPNLVILHKIKYHIALSITPKQVKSKRHNKNIKDRKESIQR
jgi:hypothetical protein